MNPRLLKIEMRLNYLKTLSQRDPTILNELINFIEDAEWMLSELKGTESIRDKNLEQLLIDHEFNEGSA